MMKKLLLLILIILSIFIVSCKDNDFVDDPAEDELYKDISCVKYTDFKEIYVSFKDLSHFFTLRIPKNWDVVKENEDFKIKLDEKEVGVIYKGGAPDLDKWKNVYSISSQSDEMTSYRCIDKYGAQESLKFRHRVYFELNDNTEQSFTIEIDYEEVDSLHLTMLQNRATLRPKVSDPKMGCLGISNPSDILIIGNSFVGTSSIYSSLIEMIDNNWKPCNVYAISRGYATVKTYAEDEYIMNSIRSGDYDAVFVCGFYSDEELAHFRSIFSACKQSGTKAVVFPAHNESASVAKMASVIDEDVIFIDWKGEIDTFIKNGMSKWDFCIQDGHSHSNALAGYVGAHMIYRGLYGKSPDGSISYAISQSKVDKMLGDYSKTGVIQNFNIEKAIILD